MTLVLSKGTYSDVMMQHCDRNGRAFTRDLLLKIPFNLPYEAVTRTFKHEPSITLAMQLMNGCMKWIPWDGRYHSGIAWTTARQWKYVHAPCQCHTRVSECMRECWNRRLAERANHIHGCSFAWAMFPSHVILKPIPLRHPSHVGVGLHDDVIKWKYFPRYWPFVLGIHWSPVKFPMQRPVMRGFDVYFDVLLNKPLSKQSRGLWFETPSCPLWQHCNVLRNFWRSWIPTPLRFVYMSVKYESVQNALHLGMS